MAARLSHSPAASNTYHSGVMYWSGKRTRSFALAHPQSAARRQTDNMNTTRKTTVAKKMVTLVVRMEERRSK